VKMAAPLKPRHSFLFHLFHGLPGRNIHAVKAPTRCHSPNAASCAGPWHATNILPNPSLAPLVSLTPETAEAAIKNQNKVDDRAAQLGFIKLVPKKETGAKKVVR
jgi:hypothetical protein